MNSKLIHEFMDVPIYINASDADAFVLHHQSVMDSENIQMTRLYFQIAVMDIRSCARKGYRRTCVYIRPHLKAMLKDALTASGYTVSDLIERNIVSRNRLIVEW